MSGMHHPMDNQRVGKTSGTYHDSHDTHI